MDVYLYETAVPCCTDTAGMTTAPSSSQTLQSDISQCYGACIMSTTLIDIHAEQYVIPASMCMAGTLVMVAVHHSHSNIVIAALVVVGTTTLVAVVFSFLWVVFSKSTSKKH